jgi:CheY-like chemotaxis protein
VKGPAPLQVLLVEDNPTDVFVIREVLHTTGLDLRIRVMGNGQEALLYFENISRDEKASCPSLVLLDLNLPRVTGIEVLKALRSNAKCRFTPVIIVTSSTAEEDRVATGKLGVEGYFEKPGDLAPYRELALLVKRVVGHNNPSRRS